MSSGRFIMITRGTRFFGRRGGRTLQQRCQPKRQIVCSRDEFWFFSGSPALRASALRSTESASTLGLNSVARRCRDVPLLGSGDEVVGLMCEP